MLISCCFYCGEAEIKDTDTDTEINEHESSQKHKACVEAHIRFSSNKTVVDLLTVSQTSLHNKQVMQRRKILDRVVSIVKMIGKWGTSCRGTGGL